MGSAAISWARLRAGERAGFGGIGWSRAGLGSVQEAACRDPAARPGPVAGVVVASGPLRRTVGCRGERLVLERWALAGEVAVPPGEGGFATLTNLGDAVEVEHAGGIVTVPRVASCLVPTAVGEVRLRPREVGKLVVCFEPGVAVG